MLYNREIFKRCFCYNKRYWYKNIGSIPLYFKQLHFLIKNGYDISAHWNTDIWFLEKMKPILDSYQDCMSYPCESSIDIHGIKVLIGGRKMIQNIS